MQKLASLLILLICHLHVVAQFPSNLVKSSSSQDRLEAVKVRSHMQSESAYTGIEAQNIGPTIMSGRVVDMAINPKNSTHFFVAYATGGVWETKNNGQSFSPIFDNNGYTIHCGALAVNWENTIIYVGTGEANSSRSSYAGYGLFKGDFSEEEIEWKHLGLEASHHIGRVILHPTDKNTLFVAAMGNLFSPNKERGVYMSKDEGANWKQVLYVNENTSAVDLEIDPSNPNRLYAAMWEKTRRGWNFVEGGSNSGVHISEDGGNSWDILSSFPRGKHIGRIGLSISNNGKVYSLIDNQERYEKIKEASDKLTKNSFKTMSPDSFKNLNDSVLNSFLRSNRFPKKYEAKDVKKMVRKNELTPLDLYHFLADANAALFEDPVKGAELYSSEDHGETWTRTHSQVLENVCYSYGYYFGVVHVNPTNADEVYIAGVPLLKSKDGGATFSFAGGDNVHVDHHFIWIDPQNPNHLINGNDGGVNISYDAGENWTKCNSPSVGQFYTVAVDKVKNYHVYGGLQDNGVWKGPNNYRTNTAWHQEGRYPYERLLGGDGMQIEIDHRDQSIYTGYQFGHYYRKDADGESLYIHPTQDLKEERLRWNWQTPIRLSSHNQDILYMASNKLHRSMDRGKTFTDISGDLTGGRKEGDVSFGTISCLSESPLSFGLLYTGSDDGHIHMSKDGGQEWQKISGKLPSHLWVRTVLASSHKKERVYALLHGHIWDHFEAYVFVSNDYGNNWKRIGNSLPKENLNVLLEDPINENMLYVGGDATLYFSDDGGEEFSVLSNLPPVAIHDMAIQEDNRDLIVATHGRGIYKIELEHLYQGIEDKDSALVLKPIPNKRYNANWGERLYTYEVRVPKLYFSLITKNPGSVKISLLDEFGTLLKSETLDVVKGFNRKSMELSFEQKGAHSKNGKDGKYYPQAGFYRLRIEKDGQQISREFSVTK